MMYVMGFLYFASPVGAVVFFVLSLCQYLSAKKRNKHQPGSVSPEFLRSRKIMLIVSSAIVSVLALVVIAFMVLLYSAVAFM